MMIWLLTFAMAHAACFHPVQIKPEQVYDGDTIQNVVIQMDFGITVKKTIRLIGIDTPELRGVSKREKRKATRSRDRLRSLVSSCAALRLMPHGVDAFGRTLGKIFCGNKNLSDILLEEGLAKEYKR